MTWYSGHWCMKPTMGWVLTSSGLARGVEKEKFWRDVGEASSMESIKKVVESRLTTTSKHIKTTSLSGAYYPRSWYDAHGFDGELIERTCNDKKEHTILGTVYCAEIEAKADENEHVKQETKS